MSTTLTHFLLLLLLPFSSSIHAHTRETLPSLAWYIIRDSARPQKTMSSPCEQTVPVVKAVRPETTERLHFFSPFWLFKHFTFFLFCFVFFFHPNIIFNCVLLMLLPSIKKKALKSKRKKKMANHFILYFI